jgi:hypothetical protein
MSRAATLPARLVRGVAMGNLGRATATAALALAAPYPITTPGLVFLSMHALGTAALGMWTFAGLARSRPARTPARRLERADAVRSTTLTALYGLPFDNPDLALLMRHRAVLFGLIGMLLVNAAFRPSLQPLAFVAGFVSVVAFLLLAWFEGPLGPAVQRIVKADLVVLACLVIGVVAASGTTIADAG